MRRAVLVGLAVALAVAVAVELVVPSASHGDVPWWHRVPGAFGALGVAGCVALVAVAKLLGKLGLTAPEPDADDDLSLDPAAPGEEQ